LYQQPWHPYENSHRPAACYVLSFLAGA
jgi:hypothetical protein